MGFTAKFKGKTSNSMGFLLVFFPEDHSNSAGNAAINVEKQKLLPSPSSSSSSPSAFIRRSNSNNPILSRAQSTISICALLVFITVLLFTLSTFEPTIPAVKSQSSFTSSRRFLHQTSPENRRLKPNLLSSWMPKTWVGGKGEKDAKFNAIPSIALQRMGVLYRRGTKAMNDLVVAHVVENVSENEFRLFLRLLHRSGLLAKSDVVFIFNSPARFASVIEEENESFLKLLDYYEATNFTTGGDSPAKFDITQFVNSGKKENQWGEPIWGKRIRSNNSVSEGDDAESTRRSYGSIVGFDAAELDPENSLAGFLDHVPMSLRRWACYSMLLGRVRRKFKHVVLVDVKNILVLGDPLARFRNRSPETVIVLNTAEKSPAKHGRRNSEKNQPHHRVNPGIMMGGDRGIRRFSNAMLTEIVRAAMERKKKSSVSESTVLSQLVGNEFLLKDSVSLTTLTESVLDSGWVVGSNQKEPGSSLSRHSIIRRSISDNHDLNSVITKEICSREVGSSVYKDC